MIFLKLFLTFFKIGLFTFGGGYAMLPLIQEAVLANAWLSQEQLINFIAVSESTPGPFAINIATYIGNVMGTEFGILGGIFGAFCATLGVVLPSFIIIYIISLFLDKFLTFELVAYAFRGIQAGVVYLILSAGIKMLKGMKKNPMSIAILCTVLTLMVLFSVFAIDFSAIFFILISAAVGLAVFGIGKMKSKREEGEK